VADSPEHVSASLVTLTCMALDGWGGCHAWRCLSARLLLLDGPMGQWVEPNVLWQSIDMLHLMGDKTQRCRWIMAWADWWWQSSMMQRGHGFYRRGRW